MTKAAAPQKDDATARLKLGSIVKRTALTVTWLACCFAGAAAMASCANGGFDCEAQPGECIV